MTLLGSIASTAFFSAGVGCDRVVLMNLRIGENAYKDKDTSRSQSGYLAVMRYSVERHELGLMQPGGRGMKRGYKLSVRGGHSLVDAEAAEAHYSPDRTARLAIERLVDDACASQQKRKRTRVRTGGANRASEIPTGERRSGRVN